MNISNPQAPTASVLVYDGAAILAPTILFLVQSIEMQSGRIYEKGEEAFLAGDGRPAVVIVEATTRDHRTGRFVIHAQTYEGLLRDLEHRRRSDWFAALAAENRQADLFCIGSVDFCQAALQYAATAHDWSCPHWAVSLMRTVTGQRHGVLLQAVDYDSDYHTFAVGNLPNIKAA